MTRSSANAAAEMVMACQPTAALARLAALKTMSMPDLKQQWRLLFGAEPPAFSRTYLQSRLAYRIQELTHGGLRPETAERRCSAGSWTAATRYYVACEPMIGRSQGRGW